MFTRNQRDLCLNNSEDIHQQATHTDCTTHTLLYRTTLPGVECATANLTWLHPGIPYGMRPRTEKPDISAWLGRIVGIPRACHVSPIR